MPGACPADPRFPVSPGPKRRCPDAAPTALDSSTLETTLKAVIFAILLASATTLAAQSTGRFEGKVVVEWLADDAKPDRDMRLVEPFTFVDANQNVWRVPEGAIVNGASIPRPLWSLFGAPFVGDHRRASVVHDHYCTTMSRPWPAVHRMFFDALLASGVPRTRAKAFYSAVLRGGPRWSRVAGAEPGGSEFTRVTPDVSETELAALEAWVLTNDPPLNQLEREVQRLIEENR